MMRRHPPALLVALAILTVAGSAVALGVWTRSDVGSLPTTLVAKGTFVDYLQVRGEVRPVRSTVLTAPSSGGDMQILELVANGAAVTAGDVVVQFDTTVQQRALEQRRSELKQADSEIARVEADGRRRLQAAETELAQARSAASRAELDTGGADLRSKVEAEKFALLHVNARHQVNGLEQKVAGEKQSVAADIALARQKRNKAAADVADTERIMAALTLRAPAAGTITILPNMRAGGPFNRTAPEFRRGDRVWVGAPRRSRSRPRAARHPGAHPRRCGARPRAGRSHPRHLARRAARFHELSSRPQLRRGHPARGRRPAAAHRHERDRPHRAQSPQRRPRRADRRGVPGGRDTRGLRGRARHGDGTARHRHAARPRPDGHCGGTA
jgi:hypothetical protein